MSKFNGMDIDDIRKELKLAEILNCEFCGNRLISYRFSKYNGMGEVPACVDGSSCINRMYILIQSLNDRIANLTSDMIAGIA